MPSPECLNPDVTGLILAGGRARRMGGVDKGLIELNGRPLVSYVIDALRPQTRAVAINANRSIDRYREFGLAVWPDTMDDYLGPLAGMLTGLANCQSTYIVTCPCDGPFISASLVAKLMLGLTQDGADIAVAHDGERLQPVYSLLKTQLRADLENALKAGERKIDKWYATQRVAICDFTDQPETFLNINTPSQRDEIEHRMVTKSR